MIAARQIAPHPSVTWDTPERFPTGFSYVANVPPMAVGPQFAGALGQPGPLQLHWAEVMVLLALAGAGAAAGAYAAHGIDPSVARNRPRYARRRHTRGAALGGVIGAGIATSVIYINRRLQS